MNRKQFLESVFGLGVAFGGRMIFKKKGWLSFLFKPEPQILAEYNFDEHADPKAADSKWHHYAYTEDRTGLWGKNETYYLDGVEIPKDECLLQVGSPNQITFSNKNAFEVEISSLLIYDNGVQCWAKIGEMT